MTVKHRNGLIWHGILINFGISFSIITQNKTIRMNKNQKFLIGSVGALLTGIAIGLLVAPKSGKESRKLIKNRANDLGGTAKDKYEKSLDELTVLAEKLKDGFLKNVNTVKDKAGTVAETVNDKVRSVVNNNA
jgi:gas vesicle protein